MTVPQYPPKRPSNSGESHQIPTSRRGDSRIARIFRPTQRNKCSRRGGAPTRPPMPQASETRRIAANGTSRTPSPTLFKLFTGISFQTKGDPVIAGNAFIRCIRLPAPLEANHKKIFQRSSPNHSAKQWHNQQTDPFCSDEYLHRMCWIKSSRRSLWLCVVARLCEYQQPKLNSHHPYWDA